MEAKYRPLAIDADSLAFIAYSRTEDKENIEEMYQSFLEQIHSIKFAYQSRFRIKAQNVKEFILLTPEKTFRNRVYKRYKTNREPKARAIIILKELVYNRLRTKVWALPDVEADDIIVTLINSYGYAGAAYDKDVINVARGPVFNYKKRKWHSPEPVDMSEEWYVIQSLMGDGTDGIRGAVGVGKAGAETFMVKHKMQPSWEDFCKMFKDGEEEALQTMQVIRMDQWDPKKGLTLWTPDKWKWRGYKK